MITVEKADITLFDKIYPLLRKFNNPDLKKSDFQRLFDTQWSSNFDYCGYVLMDRKKVVGFIGTLFSERIIKGKQHQFCNLTCWIVEDDYRQHSLHLLFPILSLKNITITNLSPSQRAEIIFKAFKFKILEKKHIIFPYIPYLLFPEIFKFKISDEKNIIDSRLNKIDLNLFHDHCSLFCKHLLIYHQHKSDYCYLIFNKIKKKKIGFTQILYISNAVIFRKLFPCIQFFFLKRNKTFFTLIDERLLQDAPFGVFKRQLKLPKLYRSYDLEADEIDNLYTEMYLLNM